MLRGFFYSLFKVNKNKPMSYREAVKYLENAGVPSYMILDSLDDAGGIAFKSIDRKVLEAQKIVKENLVKKCLNYKFKK